jgi:Ca2+-binding RTX toxin-like protein
LASTQAGIAVGLLRSKDPRWHGVGATNNALAANGDDDWLGATVNNNQLDGGTGNDPLTTAPGGQLRAIFNYRASYAQDEIMGFFRHAAGAPTCSASRASG